MHPIINKHSSIAWDMDHTLVNGPNSAYFLDYIRSHPEKTHNIITFRDNSWANMILSELAQVGFDARTHISAIYNCPEDIHDSFMVKSNEITEIFQFMQSRSMSSENFDKNVQLFPLWKGFKCKNIGATVLIDDMPELVLPGCEKYGIEYVNALDLPPIRI